MKYDSKVNQKAAFSLVELMIVVAAIAALAGGALLAISGAVQAARDRKLSKDVVTINAALATFIANGGTLDGATTSSEIIERLKSNVSVLQNDQMVGLRSGMLDPRITPVTQSTQEASSSDARVLWDASKKRFVVKYVGASGIKKFILDESKASAGETYVDRKLVVEYSKKGSDKWVWEYVDHSTSGSTGPGNLPPGGTTPTGPGPYTPPATLQLDPPAVSIPGDTYPIIDYEGLQVTLNNPNPVGTSEMFYSLVTGVWERYVGPIPIEPGANLETQAVTMDPDSWGDSDLTDDEYRTTPEKLEIEADFFQTQFNYVSLGGGLEAGSTAPTLAAPGQATLTNSSSIPTRFQNDSVFEILWTFDGSDPLSSSTAIKGDPFTDGFPGQEIPFGIENWGSSDTMTVKVAGKSLDSNIVEDSDVMEYPLGRDKIQLPAPYVAIDTLGGTIDLQLDPASSTVPLGARIYYTQNGSDPGIAGDGEPLSGTLFDNVPFTPSSSATITGRTYSPVAYKDWFIPSDTGTGSINVIGTDELYVGGEFEAGSGRRNIARLAPDGTLDMAFDPGAGASAGSTVGAISGQGGAGVLAGGNFDTMNGTTRLGIARLRFDGSLDTGFDADLE